MIAIYNCWKEYELPWNSYKEKTCIEPLGRKIYKFEQKTLKRVFLKTEIMNMLKRKPPYQ